MNSEVYKAIISANCELNVAKLVGRRFPLQMDKSTQNIVKVTKDLLKPHKWDIHQWSSQSHDLNLITQLFSYWRQK